MATTCKSPAERIVARQKARAAKIATAQAKAAAYWRTQAKRTRTADPKWFAPNGPTPEQVADDLDRKAEELEQKLASTGHCIRCGRALTDPKSVQDSIGPECRKKMAR
jgi:hypothetical protein